MAVKGSEGTINLSIFFVTTILTTTEAQRVGDMTQEVIK